MPRLRQRRDRHRGLALAVDLRELRAEHRHGPLAIGDVHRAAAIDDGLETARVGGRGARMFDQPLDHGGRREHRHAGVHPGEIENFTGIEAATGRDHLHGRGRDLRQHVLAGAVRHRRRVQDAIAGGDGVDIRKIAGGHDQQVAMGDHGALRLAGGAAGEEQPSHVVGIDLGDRRGIAGHERLVLGRLDIDQTQAFHGERRQRLGQVGGDQAQLRPRVRQDVFELARVQLGVDRHRHETGVPGGEHRLDVLRTIAHRQRDAIARHEAEASGELAGQRRHAPLQLCKRVQRPVPERHRAERAAGERRTAQQQCKIHRDSSRAEGWHKRAGLVKRHDGVAQHAMRCRATLVAPIRLGGAES